MVEEDGFEIIDSQLPLRPAAASTATTAVDDPQSQHAVDIELHAVPKENALLVSVIPPKQPENDIPHVPCDIVLVIDVSASMGQSAPLPATDGSGKEETTGLSVLDLTKHAARTIIESLNENDRLGVVVFSIETMVKYQISQMTPENQADALKVIENLRTHSTTNLWHGITKGLKLLADAEPVHQNTQSLFILTDGMPNHMCPEQGYVPKLRSIFATRYQTMRIPIINTFGFGYIIRSGLLQGISELTNGAFAFIPEAGMLGTVFIHAMANLYTTYATQARLTIRGLEGVTLSLGRKDHRIPIQLSKTQSTPSDLVINLGCIHYGQSREFYLKYENKAGKELPIGASLSYSYGGTSITVEQQRRELSGTPTLPSYLCNYHRARAQMCQLLRSQYSLRKDGEYVPLVRDNLKEPTSDLEKLASDIVTSDDASEKNEGILKDLTGEDPEGQVRLALSSSEYFNKWGQHYLLSLLNAHENQICNSFKDPGPLRYGEDSSLFCRCRQELDNCFDNLPPPKPSIPAPRRGSCEHVAVGSMGRYRDRDVPCFAGDSMVRLATSTSDASIAIRDVRPNMALWTPCGPRLVRAVVATSVRDEVLCKIGSLHITPWHPIMTESGSWAFPAKIPHEAVRFTGKVYSILLERSVSSDAHAISVGGHVCVTLGHGIKSKKAGDVRAHVFFGSYTRVLRSLSTLPRDARGVLRAVGIRRDSRTGLACSFVGQTQVAGLAGKHAALTPRVRGAQKSRSGYARRNNGLGRKTQRVKNLVLSSRV